ncbi:MAG: glucokinase [Tepidisphaeraceae bacterium]
MRILTGDIGGTNTRLAVFEQGAAGDEPKLVAPPTRYKNEQFASLDAVLVEFLKTQKEPFTDACLGAAGPVDERAVRLTNVPYWPVIEADAIAGRLNLKDLARANVLNDMSAHGSSIAAIEKHFRDQVMPVHAGRARGKGVRAIVMPGTGLGVGGLVWDELAGFHRPLPSEGGNEDLAPRDDEEDQLVRSMRKLCAKDGLGRCTREFVVSGPGLRSIYACLRDPQTPTLDGVPKSEDLEGLSKSDALAERTLSLFVKVLGATCANVALGLLSTGGVYLGGGIANALAPRIKGKTFTDAFEATGPTSMRELVASIPVKLITYQDTGLLGAATYAANVARGAERCASWIRHRAVSARSRAACSSRLRGNRRQSRCLRAAGAGPG